MTLNTNFAGATLMSGRRKLEGPDRALDALIGLVILVAELLIGVLVVFALYTAGDAAVQARPADSEAISTGFAIALFGSIIAVGITTLIYLVRIATGRRSWPAPLWGAILMGIALVIGSLIMTGA